jgi:rod shape-determining protein MreD
MRAPVYLLLLWFSLLVQVTWAEPLTVRAAHPDMPLLLAVWFGLTADKRSAGVCGWGLGLAVDVMSAGPVGLHAFLYLIIALTIAVQRKALPGERNPLVHAVPAFAAVLFVHAAVPAMAAKLGGRGMELPLRAATADAVLAGIVGPVLFAILFRLPTGWSAKPAKV